MKLYYPLIGSAIGAVIFVVSLTTFLQSAEIELLVFGVLVGTLLISVSIFLFIREQDMRKRLEILQTFEKELTNFDGQDLDDLSQREVAFLALYDLYVRLLSKVGVQYCNIPQNHLKEYPLTDLWNQVRSILLKVDNVPNQWDKTIQTLRNMHLTLSKRDRIPSKLDLEKTPEFTKWVIKAGEKYVNKILRRHYGSLDHP